MRIISEQELKNILDKHGKWLRKESGGERADLCYADLRSANLSSANLRSANIRNANLCNTNLLTFQFNRHFAFYVKGSNIQIGCHSFDIKTWKKEYKALGKKEGYSDTEIKMYGTFIKMCDKLSKEK